LGAGSWGTALAVHLGRLGHTVRLWARDGALVDEIRARGSNTTYLPEIRMPPCVSVTASMEEAIGGTDLIVSAIPSHWCRAVIRVAAPPVAPPATVVSAPNGLRVAPRPRVSGVMAEEPGPRPPGVGVSGRSCASSVRRR